jgi:hypothetical protein
MLLRETFALYCKKLMKPTGIIREENAEFLIIHQAVTWPNVALKGS